MGGTTTVNAQMDDDVERIPNWRQIGPELRQNFKDCTAIAYYMRRFANLNYNLVAALRKRNELDKGDREWRFCLPVQRIGVENFFQILKLKPQDLDEIYTDPCVQVDKKPPYQARTWEQLRRSRNFHIGDTEVWKQLAKLINKVILVFQDSADGTYCEFEQIWEISPNGEIKQINPTM